jgi:hypothetical protein
MAFEHNLGLAALHTAIQAQNAGNVEIEKQDAGNTQVEEVVKEIDDEKKARRSRRRARKSPDKEAT